MFWLLYILYICVLALYFQSEHLVRLSLRQRRTFWTLSTAGISAALFFLEDRPLHLPWLLDHVSVRFCLWLATVVLVRRFHWSVITKLHLTGLSKTGVQTLKSQRPPRFLPNDLGMGLLLDQLLAPLDEINLQLGESESEGESEPESSSSTSTSSSFSSTSPSSSSSSTLTSSFPFLSIFSKKNKHDSINGYNNNNSNNNNNNNVSSPPLHSRTHRRPKWKQSTDDRILQQLLLLIKELSSIDGLGQMFGAPRRKTTQLTEEILGIFDRGSPSQINYWLPQLNFPHLLTLLSDSRYRLSLAHSLLALQPKLSALTLTVLIDGIQKADTAFSRSDKDAVLSALLQTTHGATLRDLKLVLDHRLSHHNMNRLIFKDLSSPAVRLQVLEHVRHQARLYADDRCLKVLSDIDDTLFSSGGPPGGVDNVFPKGQIYPGVIEFYLELLRGLGNPQFDSTITFLSARPSVGDSGITENATYQRLQAIWAQRKVPSPIPNLLPGSLRGSGPSLFGKMGGIAAKKFENFTEYAAIYPEARFVFIGDNGQADVQTAEKMREAMPDRVLAAFIHDVLPEQRKAGPSSSPQSPAGNGGSGSSSSAASMQGVAQDSPHAAQQSQGGEGGNVHDGNEMITFHRTYIGAAISAFGSNMISAVGLYSVTLNAVRQLETITGWKSALQKAKVLQSHHADLETVNQLILEHAVPGPEIHMHPELYAMMQETLHPVSHDTDEEEDDEDDEEGKELFHDDDDDDDDDDLELHQCSSAVEQEEINPTLLAELEELDGLEELDSGLYSSFAEMPEAGGDEYGGTSSDDIF